MAYIAKRKKRSATLIPKYTTRRPRAEEQDRRLPTDLRFPPDTEGQFRARTRGQGFYWYSYGRKGQEELYGFYRDDIDQALAYSEVGLIIVRDFDTIAAVKRDLPHVDCVSVFVYTDRDLVEARLREEGYSEEAIEFRLSRQPLAWADYVKHASHYDEKIINSSNRGNFELLIEALFRDATETPPDRIRVAPYTFFPLVAPLIGFKSHMQKRLQAQPYERNVFLMMKFRKENEKVYKFTQRTLAERGLNCVLAKEAFWDITRNTYNPVAVLFCCKYGIALFDLPEPGNDYSANVAYELGMMHDQGKECLILRHTDLQEMPFDLVKDLYVNYSDNLELEGIIQEWVDKVAT